MKCVRILAALLALALAAPAHAQVTEWLWWGATRDTMVPVSNANPLPVTGAGGGGGSLTITDGTNTVAGVTTLSVGNGNLVGGTSPNATLAAKAPNRTTTSSDAIGAADMTGQVNFNGSGLTATIPAISSSVLAAGMTTIIANQNASALTVSSTPTINGCPTPTTIPQYGWMALTSNGTSLDCFGPSTSGSGISGSGTANTLSKFTGATAIGNSSLTDDGSITTLSEALALSGTLSPAAFSADQNDYNPTGLSTAFALRLGATGATRNITGLAGGVDGRVIDIINVGSQNIILNSQNTSSSAANRFVFLSDVTIPPNGNLALRYDGGSTTRWRPLSATQKSGAAGQIAEYNTAGTTVQGATVSGDISYAAGGAMNIAVNAVTNTKLAQMAAHTFKGNNTGSPANALDLNATQITAELNPCTTTLKGLVPAPPNVATQYLDGTCNFSTPAGGGGTPVFFAGPQTAGSANTYTQATTTPSGFTLTDGFVVRTRINATNTAASTLNVNSTGAVAIKTNTATGLAALVGGELVANLDYDFTYNAGASAFVVTNSTMGAVSPGTSQTITAAQWASFTIFDVTTAGQTITIPVSTGLTSSGGIVVKADTQSVTITSTSPDTINGGSAGGSVTVPSGVMAVVTTTGAGQIYTNLGNAAASTSVAGIVKLHNVAFVAGWIPTINPNTVPVFTAKQAMTVTAIRGHITVATGGTATVSVYKAASGTACASGTLLHSSGSINANGTANTDQDLTVTTSALADGDTVCLVTTGTTTWTGGTGLGIVNVYAAPS